MVCFLRFIQTGHSENYRFEGRKCLYTVWLVGCYGGKKSEADEGETAEPPEVPPVPAELME